MMHHIKQGMRAALIGCGAMMSVGVCALQAQDASEILLRLNRMENQMRQIAGELEQVQFENKRLHEQLQKFQQDVEFRFQDNAAKNTSGSKSTTPQKKSDAYDPTQVPQGSSAQANSAQAAAGGPLNLTQAGGGRSPSPSAPGGGSVNATAPIPFATANAAQANTGSIAPAKPQNTYAEGYNLMQQKKYAEAESVLRAYIQAHPKDTKMPDATYWLGESYLRRSQYAGAAEQFLKVYQTYPKANLAPESLYKLALSLKGLNQKPQACATLAEWGRRYPAADKNLKSQVEQETKKLAC